MEVWTALSVELESLAVHLAGLKLILLKPGV
jgi:hypothetical protein